jgi:hypothetical protein
MGTEQGQAIVSGLFRVCNIEGKHGSYGIWAEFLILAFAGLHKPQFFKP